MTHGYPVRTCGITIVTMPEHEQWVHSHTWPFCLHHTWIYHQCLKNTFMVWLGGHVVLKVNVSYESLQTRSMIRGGGGDMRITWITKFIILVWDSISKCVFTIKGSHVSQSEGQNMFHSSTTVRQLFIINASYVGFALQKFITQVLMWCEHVMSLLYAEVLEELFWQTRICLG